MQKTQVRSPHQNDPLDEEMATHSSIPAWEIPWAKELGGLQSMGSQRVGHDGATKRSTWSAGWVCVISRVSPVPALCDPLDCSPPGSSVHGLSQAGILEWVATSCSRRSSRPKDQTHVSSVHLLHWLADSLPLSSSLLLNPSQSSFSS